MTDTEARSLGQRWIAELRERAWTEGMLAIWPDVGGRTPWARVISMGDDGAVYEIAGDPPPGDGASLDGAVPDLRDPATIGAALGALREVWGFPQGIVVPLDRGRWGWKSKQSTSALRRRGNWTPTMGQSAQTRRS